MKVYHSTAKENLASIMSSGLGISKSAEAILYFGENVNTAAAFQYIRGIKECIVFEIDLPDTFPLKISTDHDDAYYKTICKDFGKCYYSEVDIPSKYIISVKTVRFK